MSVLECFARTPFPARFATALTCLLVAPCLGFAADSEDTVAGTLRREQGAAMRQSAETGIPLLVTITPRVGAKTGPLADRRWTSRMRWFLAVNAKPDTKLAKLLASGEPTLLAFLDSEGKTLATVTSKDRTEKALVALKEVALNARAQCLEKLAKETGTEAEYKTAVEALIRMGATAAELMPLLTHKSATVKAAVQKALAALFRDRVTLAAWDGLASADAEMRTACYRWAIAGSRVAKTPALKFWQEASEEERGQALTKWRDAGMVDLGPANPDVLEFVEAYLGKPVGDGESPTLATEALLDAQAEPPKIVGKETVWGREVKRGQKVLPGDLVYEVNCRFRVGNELVDAPRHVVVIRKLLAPGKYEVLEQNVNGRKSVSAGILDLGTLIQGTVKIYRPVLK